MAGCCVEQQYWKARKPFAVDGGAVFYEGVKKSSGESAELMNG
jgi:hypothetical protein